MISCRNVVFVQNIGDPIRQRHYEAENRSRYLQEFGKTLQKIDETLKSLQTKCVNSDRNDIEKVQKMLEEKTKFYKQTETKFRTVRPQEDAPIFCAQIQREQEVRHRFLFFSSVKTFLRLSLFFSFQILSNECWSILNKLKAKVESTKKPSTN